MTWPDDPASMSDEELAQAIYVALEQSGRARRLEEERAQQAEQDGRADRWIERHLAVPPPVARLAYEEVEHYRWLIDGILIGVERLAAQPAIVNAAVSEVRDLFAEFIARVEQEVSGR